MTTEKQIIAIAELDGWKHKNVSQEYKGTRFIHPDGSHRTNLPRYVTSRDAIVPVIEKVCFADQAIKVKFLNCLRDIVGELSIKPHNKISDFDLIVASPSQLAEALLRATGKWSEE